MSEQLTMLPPPPPEHWMVAAHAQGGPFLRRYCLFSGGGDSAAVAHRMRDHYDELVFIDTGTAIGPDPDDPTDTTPSVRAHVVRFAEWLGKPLRIYEAGDEYERMVTGGQAYRDWVAVVEARYLRKRGVHMPRAAVYRIAEERMARYRLPGRRLGTKQVPIVGLPCGLPLGFPGPLLHGRCYNRLKERSIEALTRDTVAEYGKGNVLLVTGVRRQESLRRAAREPVTTKGARVFVNPLIDWSTPAIKRYAREHGLPQSEVALLLHRSGECGCAAYANVGERAEVRSLFPKWFARVIEPLEAWCREYAIPSDLWGAGPHSPEERAMVKDGRRACALYAKPDAIDPEPTGLICQNCELFNLDLEAAPA